MPFIHFQTKKIFYKDSGKGKAIVLLHGFTESLTIWKEFSRELSPEYRIVTIDLPGHGKSEMMGKIHTMELMAEIVRAVLRNLRIKKCLMIGHSMGGFVTLAFAGKYPNMLKGIGLFHSHPFADTAEGQEMRDRNISILKADKFGFLTQFFPSLFTFDNRLKHEKSIKKLISEAEKMSKEAIIAVLEGMRIRPDRSYVLGQIKIPVLFIVGLQDTRVPVDKTWEMIRLPEHSEVLLLKNTAHMGFIEAKKETLSTMKRFAGLLYT